MHCCVQEVLGLLEGDPVYWEPGRLKVRLFHEHSKQALAVSERRGVGVGGGRRGRKREGETLNRRMTVAAHTHTHTHTHTHSLQASDYQNGAINNMR